jgi:Tfp pilus assembly protein PilF
LADVARLHDAGRLDEARRVCLNLVAQEPNNAAAISALGAIAFSMGAADEAFKRFARAVELEPANPGYHHNLVVAARKVNRIREALAVFTTASSRVPEAWTLHDSIAKLHLERGDVEAAHITLRKAAEIWPSLPPILTNLGVVLCRLNRWDECVLVAERLVATDPKNPGGWFLRVSSLGMTGQLSRALGIATEFAKAGGDIRHPLAKNIEHLAADFRMLEGLKRTAASSPPAARAEGVPRDDREASAVATVRTQTGPATDNRTTVVFYHVDSNDKHPLAELAGEPLASIDYADVLKTAVAAARRSNPGAHVVVLTDESSDMSRQDSDCRIIRMPTPRGQMMYARMRAYRALLASRTLNGPVLFLDTDVCLNRDFGPLFDGGFDIGLTYRLEPRFLHMPVNEGLIVAADGASAAAARFFETCLDLYDRLAEAAAVRERYPFDVRMWRGGQLALGAFVDWRVPPNRPQDDAINGVRCRFLPCDDFNFAVEHTTPEAEMAAKWAIHFKGIHKKKMSKFAGRSTA